MKIVHAIWEKRNLGVDCNEIIIEKNDTLTTLNEIQEQFESEYTVIKVPSDKFEICNKLQEQGYIFVETIVNCYNQMKLPELNSVQKRIIDAISYNEMNSIDIDELLSEVYNDMFETDRISMDKNFTSEQANNRYIGWIKDELNSGSKFYKLIYKDNTIGFFILRNNENRIYTAVLGGIYKNFKSYGFGFSMNYFQIVECINQKATKVYNTFSSNNKGAFSLHFIMNYNVDTIYNIFVKHKKH